MPLPTSTSAITTARSDFLNARRVLIDALYQAEVAENELREVQRSFAEGTPEQSAATAANQAAQTTLAAARSQESGTRQALQAELATWLPDGSTPDEDLERLNASSPIVLFPLHLETRFEGNTMKLRVFPDEVFLDIHEKALTEEEFDAAKKYYEDLNENGNERELWRDFVAQFGAERGAYLLREMLPVFGDPGPTSDWGASSSFCGGTLTGGNLDELFFFDDVQLRTAEWTRPGEAVLPDRWVVITYRGGTRKVHLGNRIAEPTQLTLDPAIPEDQLESISDHGYKVDKNIKWMVDFDTAVQAGMGLEIGLTAEEAAPETGGFDRIIVVGVKSSMTELEGSDKLEQLLDAHHYTRGLALVRQGSATNNLQGEPTNFPAKDEAGARSFVIERQKAPLDRRRAHHCLPWDTDGHALALTLGVPSGVMANIDRAYQKEIDRGRRMNDALWPATLGYFMQFMMDPVFSEGDIQDTRLHFRNNVLARGMAPAFRIGATPYGVMPIGALKRWEERPESDPRTAKLESAMVSPLLSLMQVWKDASSDVPRVTGDSPNPDIELAQILALQPSSEQFRVRFAQGEETQFRFSELLGWNFGSAQRRFRELMADLFGLVGRPEWRPRIGSTLFNDSAFLLTGTRVADEPSEDLPLQNGNFLVGIANATVIELINDNVAGKPSEYNLLYYLLRHSLLVEYARLVDKLVVDPFERWREHELWFLPGVPPPKTIIEHMTELGEVVRSQAGAVSGAMLLLASSTTAELDRLLTETLDLASHRLDAWVSSFPTQRLSAMRAQQTTANFAPRGDYLGGYGWLEDVRPRTRTTTEVPGIGTADLDPRNGGLIQTPSMTHAAAAAVLRSAHMSFRDEEPAKYAVDLSSRRVRDARGLFEAVRNGQHVGALLGYQFERGIRDGHPDNPDLDGLRFKLRELCPLVANKGGNDPDAAPEKIAARNVVDGERLLRRYQAGTIDFAGDPDLPSPGSADHTIIVSELEKLQNIYDAAADLLLAESVYQMASGNIDAAIPTLNNVSKGGMPPDSVISKSARGGIDLTHKVSLVFPSDAGPTLPANWPDPNTSARATAEPVLNAWVGQLLGDPATISCMVDFTNEDDSPGSEVVRLSELGLSPADLLVLAETIAAENQGSMLERRILFQALGDVPRKEAQINFSPADPSERAFPDILEVVQTAGKLVRSSRPLAVSDLLTPADEEQGLIDGEADAVVHANELLGRATAAVSTLRTVTDENGSTDPGSLDVALQVSDEEDPTPSEIEALRAALKRASQFAVESAYPQPGAAASELLASARAIQEELRRRLDLLPDIIPSSSPSHLLRENAANVFEAVFGTSFVALPRVEPPSKPELGLSLEARNSLLGADGEKKPEKHLRQIMRVRDRLGVLRKLDLYSRALGNAKRHVQVVQLPHIPGERWLGLPFEEDFELEEGRLALLLLTDGEELDPLNHWTGLVVDDWSEIIPNKKEETGIAFHYDSPQAEAPQAVLVAVPSSAGDNWQFEDLVASLEQTMDLAKIRTVDAERLELGQVLPATVMAQNDNPIVTVQLVVDQLRRALDSIGLSF